MSDFEEQLKRHLKADPPDHTIDLSELDQAVLSTLPEGKVIRFPAWIRAAAALLVLGFSTLLISYNLRSGGELAREDINRDGQVDIVDAFVLASRLEEGRVETLVDLTGDGVIDQADVLYLSAKAVEVGS